MNVEMPNELQAVGTDSISFHSSPQSADSILLDVLVTCIYNIYKVDPHYLHLMFASSFHNEPHHPYYFEPSDHHPSVQVL
jgi:hypothetical protein